MKINALNQLVPVLDSTETMPVLFLGHGSPMNALEENDFVAGWRAVGKTLPKPTAILCISAHWETKGTFVTAMEKPRTIHDFGGFPQALFDMEYPAPGSQELANQTRQLIKLAEVGLDQRWGLDHGCWSVLCRLFPKADIPIVQLSLDYSLSPERHYALAKELAELRNKGILIVGSGNLVHNLGALAWDRLNDSYGYDWALEANDKMKELIQQGDHKALINYSSLGKAFQQAIPTPEHYLPLLYALALQRKGENIQFFNDQPVGGSLTMTSVKIFS